MDESVAFHIEEYFFVDNFDQIIEKLPIIKSTTLFSPRFPTFPIVDFIILNGSAECHLFQVTVPMYQSSATREHGFG